MSQAQPQSAALLPEPSIALIDYMTGGRDAGYPSKSPLYAATRAGIFPMPIKVGRRSFMTNRERDAMVLARVAGKTDAQLQELVKQLHAARAAAA